MKQLNEDVLRALLADTKVCAVSQNTGLHRNTIMQFRDNKTETTPETIDKIRAYFIEKLAIVDLTGDVKND